MTSTGPSIRGVCRILNQSSCGSGSICGIRDGKSLILTNAHVAGSRVGRVVTVEVESTGDRIQARVIAAAYSDRTWTDWALLETVEPYDKVKPVYLSKNQPTGSHYTKGFPRCQPFSGSDITTINITSQGVWTWKPNAIGGQSGSGVFSDVDHFAYGLLTWSIGRDGGGQTTAQIYRQARDCTLAGAPRVDGMKEMDDDQDFDWTGIDRSGMDDPIVEPGLFVQRSVDITTMPIWAEDMPGDGDGDDGDGPNDPNDMPVTKLQKIRIESCRGQIEALEKELRQLQGLKPPTTGGQPVPDNDDAIQYGL